MRSPFARIALVLLVLAACVPPGYGKPAKELVSDLQAALKEEAANKPTTDQNESGHRARMLPDLAGQLDTVMAQSSYEVPQVLAQISAGSRSEKVQQICQELIKQLESEREQKETEFLGQADAAVKHAGEAVTSAKNEKDLDAVLQELGRLRGNRGETMSELGRRAASKLEAAAQFTTRWQDYLAQMTAENPKAAREILRGLAESSAYPIVPRSEILTRIQALADAEMKAAKVPKSLVPAKVDAICKELKTPEDIATTLEALRTLRDQFPAEVDSSMLQELEGLESLYKQIQAGLNTPVNVLDNARHFTDLRLQLALLALPRYLGLPGTFPPSPGETLGSFLDRVSAEAKRTANWPLLLKAAEASRAIRRGAGSSGNFPEPSTTSLRSFIVGQNEEQAGQYASAVASYQEALRDTENLVPLEVIRDRLAAIKKDHAAEFNDGVQRSLNPPMPNRYPMAYPPMMRPGYPVAPPTPPEH